LKQVQQDEAMATVVARCEAEMLNEKIENFGKSSQQTAQRRR
jgi:hypothetical protein